MTSKRISLLMLNVGHFMDHLFTLIFASVAALTLYQEWNIPYAELLPLATPGLLAFGLFSFPAGWLADRWSRHGMMCVFFYGAGLAAIFTGLAMSPLQIALGLFLIGMFAAIYHPVGLAIITTDHAGSGLNIAINGVWGNLGVASAALISGLLIDAFSWRLAFILPGLFSIVLGLIYHYWHQIEIRQESLDSQMATATSAEISEKQISEDQTQMTPASATDSATAHDTRLVRNKVLLRLSIIIFITTALSALIFQSVTFALPKIFDERLQGLLSELSVHGIMGLSLDNPASFIGSLTFIVFAVASFAQLVTGYLLDRISVKPIFFTLASIQCLFFYMMPGLSNASALFVALGFMLGAFGQIPINDYLIGKTAQGKLKAQIYGIRYVVSYTVIGLTLPFTSYVYQHWGFDTLFQILSLAAGIILLLVLLLPAQKQALAQQHQASLSETG